MNARCTLGLIASATVLLITGLLSGQAPMVDPSPLGASAARFITCDITIDSSGAPLAAWQIDLRTRIDGGSIELVGVEGSPTEAGKAVGGSNKNPFESTPFYDPEALTRDHIILAAFSTAAPASLPTGPTRIARLHMRITGAAAQPGASIAPDFTTTLITAADPTGAKITPTVRASLGDTP